MSQPWKIPKSSRILRFISEFQNSPKRGGSLFVETGFPASLIDLFFKNRDRFKKPTSKRFQRIERQIQTAPNASSLINHQDTILGKPPKRESVRSKIEKSNCVNGKLPAENKNAIKNNVCVCGGGGAFVLMAFKVLIVALLAFSTKKKLTIGITLSTFALLLTELVAARVFTRPKLCNTDENKNAISRVKIETLDETQVPKSVPCPKETEQPVKAETEDSNSKDTTIRDLLSKDEKSRSKSSRLKSKIVKKLRSYNMKKKKKTMKIKEESSSLVEVSSLVVEDKTELRTESAAAERDEEKLKDQSLSGTALIVIVLTSLLFGKILAIVLTLSCLVLRFGVAKKI
ncbi:PREDICTED: uncharacterized protein LOC104771595 [Camelina sativa]|uniref:Uncharacterized protein LOC104771595 n=1 Tax=Camelina sativa TaxID=90675 RepID=A0ABM0Y2H1_CAMSA|nr:PREDICTED: uncharacterized protein LOC104771595 [Camelina sativa]